MSHIHHRLAGLVLALAALAAGIALGAGLSPSVSATPREAARVDGTVITRVTGSAAYGFSIRHLNGNVQHPETRSEALAECLGYPRATARARCRGHLTTWYADLATLQRSIRYYRSLSR